MNHLLKITALLGLITTSAVQAADLPSTVEQSHEILLGRQSSASPIPQKELDEAKGVAIIDITKGGFVVGGIGGDGVVLVKIKSGLGGFLGARNWSAPIPIGFSGGSFGAQIGGSNTKAIVLLNSDRAVERFTKPGKVGWSASATGTVGGDHRSEQEGGLLNDSDIKIFQSTEGLYGGAVFGGSSLSINNKAISRTYGSGKGVRDILEGGVSAPPYAKKLVEVLNGKR
ncbi:MAG: lipid-binding SYLF domain-containing protein [Candidatus Methylacidiphilales bacterium]|nr:lipid-binding SYLF domain-containing protein [Candidatus Methylacidiphilales bacterium]